MSDENQHHNRESLDRAMQQVYLSPEHILRHHDREKLWDAEFIDILQNPLRVEQQASENVDSKLERKEIQNAKFRVDGNPDVLKRELYRFFEDTLKPAGWSSMRTENGYHYVTVYLTVVRKHPPDTADSISKPPIE